MIDVSVIIVLDLENKTNIEDDNSRNFGASSHILGGRFVRIAEYYNNNNFSYKGKITNFLPVIHYVTIHFQITISNIYCRGGELILVYGLNGCSATLQR
jgi:hypothetical protein